jgi:hypothetical protein
MKLVRPSVRTLRPAETRDALAVVVIQIEVVQIELTVGQVVPNNDGLWLIWSELHIGFIQVGPDHFVVVSGICEVQLVLPVLAVLSPLYHDMLKKIW